MSIPYEVKSATLDAGGEAVFWGDFRYITLLSATAPDSVSISFDGGSFYPLIPGVAISDFKSDQLHIRNDSLAQNTIKIFAGSASLRDNRFTLDTGSPIPTNVLNFPPVQVVRANNLPNVVAVGGGPSDNTTLRADIASSPITFSYESTASTNEVLLSAGPHAVRSICAINTTVAAKYLRLFNIGVTPLPGTDIPDMVIAIPALSSKEMHFTNGILFSAGLGICITGGAAYNDATATAAHDVHALISFHAS